MKSQNQGDTITYKEMKYYKPNFGINLNLDSSPCIFPISIPISPIFTNSKGERIYIENETLLEEILTGKTFNYRKSITGQIIDLSQGRKIEKKDCPNIYGNQMYNIFNPKTQFKIV